jgi:hypothetical protein
MMVIICAHLSTQAQPNMRMQHDRFAREITAIFTHSWSARGG